MSSLEAIWSRSCLKAFQDSDRLAGKNAHRNGIVIRIARCGQVLMAASEVGLTSYRRGVSITLRAVIVRICSVTI